MNTGAENSCGLEGVKGRPVDCKNNPWRYPDNHRPDLCRQCPTNKRIPKIAEEPLSPIYIDFKNIRISNLDYEQNLIVNNQLKKLIP